MLNLTYENLKRFLECLDQFLIEVRNPINGLEESNDYRLVKRDCISINQEKKRLSNQNKKDGRWYGEEVGWLIIQHLLAMILLSSIPLVA